MVGVAHAPEVLGREDGKAGKTNAFSLGEGVADAHRAVVGNADDVAGMGVLGDFAVPGHEEDRAAHHDVLAGAHLVQLHAPVEMARAHAEEGDAVAVVAVHVGLDLEYEPGDGGLPRLDDANVGRVRARFRGVLRQQLEQGVHAVTAQRAAEDDGGQVAGAVGIGLEIRVGGARQFHVLAGRGQHVGGEQRVEIGVADAGARDGPAEGSALDLGGRQKALAGEVVTAVELAAHAERPHHRRDIELQGFVDLVEQLEGIAALAVHLVDEGHDRDVAQAAHLEQLLGLALDAFRRVDHHDRRIDRRQRPVGILAEVLVPGRVQEVEDEAAVLEGHHRAGHRNAALLFDLQPVGAGAAAVAPRLDVAGQVDGAAGEQQLLGQRRLAGVGVRNDREGAASIELRRHGGLDMVRGARVRSFQIESI